MVANEVKDLAQETARATEDISRRVQTIQADSAGAVAALADISEVIGRIDDYQSTIAAAVEQQDATTRSIGQGVTSASQVIEAPRVLCRLLVSHGGWRHAEEDRSGAEGARGAAGA